MSNRKNEGVEMVYKMYLGCIVARRGGSSPPLRILFHLFTLLREEKHRKDTYALVCRVAPLA